MKLHKIFTLLILIVFSLSSLSVCAHGPEENHNHSEENSTSIELEHSTMLSICEQHEDHEKHSDSHLCPCLCHVPVSIGHVVDQSLTRDKESIIELDSIELPNGISYRLERPPRIS